MLEFTLKLLAALAFLIAWNCFHHYVIEPLVGAKWGWIF